MSAPKTTQDALDLWRKHDPAGLYDQLEPWQQRELICAVRRVCAEVAHPFNTANFGAAPPG